MVLNVYIEIEKWIEVSEVRVIFKKLYKNSKTKQQSWKWDIINMKAEISELKSRFKI